MLIEATPEQVQQLAQSNDIQYIQQNQNFALSPVISMSNTQVDPEWGLDRIDERFLPTNNNYTSDRDGTGVTVYVLDTGIRMSHSEFNGRATSGWDFVGNDGNASDCHGHGTHIAGVIGGNTYGVAKNVNLVGVRMINCEGSTSSDLIVSGLEWVLHNATPPAIVNMSFGGVTSDLAIDNAVNALIQNNISAVAAAGNNNSNACNETPARVPNAITVGSTTSNDARSGFSNKGSCLDVFAPGTNIRSAWKSSNTSHAVMSGTSMSAAFVSGTLALGLQTKPTVSPSVARNSLVDAATLGELSSIGSGSPNKLLFTDVLIDYPSTTAKWDDFGNNDRWDAQLVGDFDGDGKDDFAHMSLEDGDWWVTLSNGNAFDMTKWGRTSDLTRWTYHLAGDFTGDGKDDVAHFDNEQGGWYVSVSSGSSFSATRWDDFSDFSGLTARLVGDFNADGKDDIANFNSDYATWWVSLSNGNQFTTTKWVDYHHEDGWKAHIVGDFNGDGESDIANYRTTTGKWGMCESLPQQDDFSTYVLSDYNTNSGWTTQVAGDFTGNGKDDIANFNPSNGTWWVTSSH